MLPTTEQSTLKFSIALTVGLGVLGVASGLATGSQAIIFDGMYSFVDVVPTIVSLVVVKLIAQGSSHRFQYGYWHLEPMVEAFGGAILALACVYAAANAINGLLAGGHEVAYGFGAAWAGILCVVGLGMAAYMRRHARRLGSGLLALDTRSWLVSGFLSMALLVGFAVAILMEQGGLRRWVPYVDSAVLLCIALAMLPVPLRATWGAIREVLQVAPDELDQQVKRVMDAIVSGYGFLRYASHVAKFGRVRFVEIHILVPPDHRFGSIADADRIRNEIAAALDARAKRFWLTIDFTGDPEWL
jgi:cation diffusion facilitator family transporter